MDDTFGGGHSAGSHSFVKTGGTFGKITDLVSRLEISDMYPLYWTIQ
ncbi:hypothetical protein [Mediterraneibacter massiliensis]|nr:hypothetical protein [Mediterraneibacter massiliensis]